MLNIFPINKSRYLEHIKWRSRNLAPRLYDWPRQFTPFSTERTNTNSCIITNGIPKCGTHLLDSLVMGLDRWVNTGIILDEFRYEYENSNVSRYVTYCVQQSAVKKLRNGQKVDGHLPWSPALEKSLGQDNSSRRYKHMLIYRDPRDAYTSHLRAIFHPEMFPNPGTVESAGGHPYSEGLIKAREQWDDDDEVLTYILKTPQFLPFNRYEPWLGEPNCFKVKFEDLYQDVLQLQHNSMGKVIKSICDHLEVDASSIRPEELYHKVYGNSRNASSERNKIGQYKRVFKDQHYTLIDNREFRRILDVFGYEW